MALLVLELLVGTSPDRSVKAPNVTVDFSAVDREVLGDSALHAAYKGLLVRLVEDGFAIAEPNQVGDIVVTVRRTSEQNLNLVVESSAGTRSRKIRFGEDAGEQAEFQLIQATIELVHGARDVLSAAPISAPPPMENPRAVGAQLGGAILWSGSAAGVMANGDAEVRVGVVRLTAGLVGHEPLGLASDLRIFEWGGPGGCAPGYACACALVGVGSGAGGRLSARALQLHRCHGCGGSRCSARSARQRQPWRRAGDRAWTVHRP